MIKLLESYRTISREDARGMKFKPFGAYRNELGPEPTYQVLTDGGRRNWITVNRLARMFDLVLRAVTFGRLRVMTDGKPYYCQPTPWKGDLQIIIYRGR